MKTAKNKLFILLIFPTIVLSTKENNQPTFSPAQTIKNNQKNPIKKEIDVEPLITAIIARNYTDDFAVNYPVEAYLAEIKKLIDKGADVNQKSKNGYTALQVAINYQDKEVVALLREKGAQ